MVFFARWKQKRDLKKVVKEVERNPSPVTASALIEKYIEMRQLDNAQKVARQSVDFYPSSNTVQGAFRHLKKVKYQDEIRRIREQIKEKPAPTLYAILAELYNELGETDRTLDICRQGIKKFPTYEGMYLIVGKIRYNRFLEEGLPKDGMLAVEFFEKALQLNGRDYKTLIRLSEIYLEIGMSAKATEKLKSLLYFAPDDEHGRELYNYAQTVPPETTTEMEEYFKAFKEKREQQEGERRSTRFSLEDIEGKLNNFPELPGMIGVVCTTAGGRKLASKILKEGLEEEILRPSIASIYSAANNSALRMDSGKLEQAAITGPEIQVSIFRFENLIFSVIASAQVKAEPLQSAIDEFIDCQLYAVREA